MSVADIGAGYGFFTFPATETVGEEGLVYAVEPDQRRAAEISRRAGERRVKNIKVLVTRAEDLGQIPTGGVDVAISISSFHHFEDKRKALDEIGRVVKTGGGAYIRDIRAGRIFKHGSDPAGFRETIQGRFPDAEIQEGSGYLIARIRI